MARPAPRVESFFFFLLAAAVLAMMPGEVTADEPLSTTSDSAKYCRFNSQGGPTVQHAVVKAGEHAFVQLVNPSGTNYDWAYVGRTAQQQAVLIPSGESHVEDLPAGPVAELVDGTPVASSPPLSSSSSNSPNNTCRATTPIPSESMPGGEEARTVQVPVGTTKGMFYHFFAFRSRAQDEGAGKPTLRLLHVEVV